MNDLTQLKRLKQLTNGSLAECKRALDEAQGDLIAAAASMLTEEEVMEVQRAVMIRASCGQSIKDPVTPEEKQLVEELADHFIAKRTRPAHVGVYHVLTERFCAEPRFRKLLAEEPERAMAEVWLTLGRGQAQLPTVRNVQTPDGLVTVVTMPQAESEWECDFVVLEHPRRKLLTASKPRVLVIFKRTKKHDRGLVNVDHLALRGGNVCRQARYYHEDAVFTVGWLATIGRSPGLTEFEWHA